MPSPHVVLTDEILKFVNDFKDVADIDSTSKAICYLISLGAEKVINMPNFKDLKAPAFSMDTPKRREISPIAAQSVTGPESLPNDTKSTAQNVKVPLTFSEVEEIFKSIHNFEKIPLATSQVLRIRIANGLKIDPSYDGTYLYDANLLQTENILKIRADKKEWAWNKQIKEEHPPGSPQEETM